MKKYILFLILFSISITSAQKKDCLLDFEEKTDSTYIKKTADILIYEKVFGNSSEMIFFSLINSDGTPLLGFQQIQKSKDFIPVVCFDKNSKIIFQLENGKIITLINSGQESCSAFSRDEQSNSNIKIITNYFMFLKESYEELKKSPISLMRIKYVANSKDIVIKNTLNSELLKSTTTPSNYFMDYLHCVE